MKQFNTYFTAVSVDEAVVVSGGVDGNLKQLLYDIAYLVGRLVRAIFGSKLDIEAAV